MSDDRLFSSNNAIGRKWYFINIVLLGFLTYFIKYLFTVHIIPAVTSDVFRIIATVTMYILYGVFILTFFSLIDRRLFDICGTRNCQKYANISAVLTLAIFWQILAFCCQVFHLEGVIPLYYIYAIAMVLDLLFFIIVVFLGFIRGKISGLTYEEYKHKIKYEDD